ncbi:phytoene/squalene synthase family protein [Corynebacterium vitaeruminis]|nr:phytoene/squalene synthase family protein [Corynebacterium vitaeruminis]
MFKPRRGKLSHGNANYLQRFDAMACEAARAVITSYSTSFSLATRLLRGRIRTDVSNLYAMVRIADEIVDGTAKAAGDDREQAASLLNEYERAVLAAPQLRFHTDPILHAYAMTARRCTFDPEHIKAFFASMRRDLRQNTYDAEEFEEYVYGSAEVIGLLCVSIFVAGDKLTPEKRRRLDEGARRLGAAFQKVNFLRDIAEDTSQLGRTYFPGLRGRSLDDATKADIVQDIREDLGCAYQVIPELPVDARWGVQAAADLFTELTDRIDALPASEVLTSRVRVPRNKKLMILARAAAHR